jgi:phosphoethanolamine N-methyltransferase
MTLSSPLSRLQKSVQVNLACRRGPLYPQAVGAVGQDYVEKNIRTWEAMLAVLATGEHCPTSLRASKPQ